MLWEEVVLSPSIEVDSAATTNEWEQKFYWVARSVRGNIGNLSLNCLCGDCLREAQRLGSAKIIYQTKFRGSSVYFRSDIAGKTR